MYYPPYCIEHDTLICNFCATKRQVWSFDILCFACHRGHNLSSIENQNRISSSTVLTVNPTKVSRPIKPHFSYIKKNIKTRFSDFYGSFTIPSFKIPREFLRIWFWFSIKEKKCPQWHVKHNNTITGDDSHTFDFEILNEQLWYRVLPQASTIAGEAMVLRTFRSRSHQPSLSWSFFWSFTLKINIHRPIF